MSVQASLNVAAALSNTKPSSNANALSGANGLSQENQLFSGILDSVGGSDAETTSLPASGLAEELGEFIGPVAQDTGSPGFLSEANLSELQGNLLPLLSNSGSIGVAGLDVAALDGINGLLNIDSLSALPLLSGSNTVLENLRSLLTGASAEGDSDEVIELRSQLLSFLDNKQANLRQEADATLSNVRGAFNDFFDKIERTRSNNFFDLDQVFFGGAQKKPAGLDDLLATLTKTSSADVSVNTQVSQNPILAQITSLISGNTVAAQPLLGAVADTSSLLLSNSTQTQVSASLNSSRWSEELGQRVRWLVGQNIGSAQIRLNPAELGPVGIRVNVSGDQVSVAFNSQFGVVREAIEAALPKLREMLESQGLNLAEADINQGNTADKQNGQDANAANDDRLALDGSLDGADSAVSNIAANVIELNSSNLVDQFV
ncbi:MAG: hypothetical protein GXP21_00465 [Gammaproteobacteria bacterium]|nr:hypothetical protein [Gammaproteobacteria bacterium]